MGLIKVAEISIDKLEDRKTVRNEVWARAVRYGHIRTFE